ncbi:MAG: NUDIX hydrolase [Caldilineaceae bacterium]|nr:NUDIX hydrolase [Caldilineaceae bacterium]
MSNNIRVRACLAVLHQDQLLLIPHYQTDAGGVQWNVPGGRVEYGEGVEAAALREFEEETGLHAAITRLLMVSEVIQPAKPWHSITITFLGRLLGGQLASESHPLYGKKVPQWFTAEMVQQVEYHPKPVIAQLLSRGFTDIV